MDEESGEGAGGLPQPSVAMLLYGNYTTDGRVKREAEALVASGFRVDVICLQQHKNESPTETVNGVGVHRVDMRRTRSDSRLVYATESLVAFIRIALRLASLNRRVGFNLVQVHTLPDFLVFAALPAKTRGARVVLDIHDLMPELFESKFGNGPGGLLGRLLRLQERAAVRFADHVITASEGFRDRLVSRGVRPDHVTVVLNTADPALFPAPEGFRLPGESGRFVLFWHGTMVRRYGVDLAIRALSEIRRSGKEFRLVLCGTGEREAELRELAAQIEVNDLIDWRGLVPHEEIPRMLSEADLGIVSNIPDTHIDLAYPAKLFEFVQMGLPVVATRTKMLEYLFRDDELIFCQADEISISEAILSAAEAPAHAREVAMRAYERVAPIAWRHEGQGYVSCIRRVLAGSRDGLSAQE